MARQRRNCGPSSMIARAVPSASSCKMPTRRCRRRRSRRKRLIWKLQLRKSKTPIWWRRVLFPRASRRRRAPDQEGEAAVAAAKADRPVPVKEAAKGKGKRILYVFAAMLIRRLPRLTNPCFLMAFLGIILIAGGAAALWANRDSLNEAYQKFTSGKDGGDGRQRQHGERTTGHTSAQHSKTG